MKVYEAVFQEGQTEGVYALSVVENPAMQDLWIALSEQPQTIEFAEVDNEKRLLLGAALIPNKKIYRNIDGNEFYITFSEETIEKLAHNFLKQQNNNNSSLEHETKLSGMSVTESWIVEDPNKDKSNLYGKTYEKGTWVAMMKVDNDNVWQKVKSGEVKGFSIDALLSLQEINLKTEIEMNEDTKKSIVEDVINGVKALFNSKEEPKEVENIEVQSEEVTPEVVEAQPEVDVEALVKELSEKMGLEFKAQLAEVEKAKNDEIEALKVELAKQPEAEEVKVSPEAKEVKLSKEPKAKGRDSIKSRVFNNLSTTFW
ncbi:MAG: hypothetical protein HRT87_04710 [Legionellales bacterium]|nr:hypothetical protein [Legionellales bacterium]